jgi:hypothetical protein
MASRRQFIVSATTLACGSLATGGCASGTAGDRYDTAVLETWHHSDGPIAEPALLQRELVRYATLAPSSHNTQCWRFAIAPRTISILPDLARRCPAVDPDDHHLFVSLGCATENLVQAALANGLMGAVRFDAAAMGAVHVGLEPTQARASALFEAIPQRQCTRGEFDGQALRSDELDLLERAGSGDGVRVILLTDKAMLERVLAFVVEGNTAQIEDPAFVEELKHWIRFSRDEAAERGDGLFSGSSGSPSVPRWFGSLMFGMLFTAKAENDKYAKQVRSSAGIAVFVSEVNDRQHWVETGRCYERFALQAAALGVRNAMLNQPVEVPALRPKFAELVGVAGRRPDLVVRFGRGPLMPRSLRRPLSAVLSPIGESSTTSRRVG